MTTLAYDPERLQALARRMAAAGDELHRLHSDDPLAAAAISAALRAARTLEMHWLPVVRRLLTTDPLGVLRVDATGVQTLVQVLATVDPDVLHDDPQQWGMVASTLQLIDRDPALHRLLLDRMLDTLQPYAAALLVPHLRLDAQELARVADHLVLRWCDEVWTEASIGTVDQFIDRTQPNPADVLFPLLAARPDAARQYVALAAAHPRTVLAATSHHDLAHRVVLVATDPARVDVATAGRLLVPLLDWYRADLFPYGTAAHDEHWSTFLADAIAPWTRQLGPLNHDWGLTANHQRDLVAMLVQHDATLERLLQRADTIRDSLLAQAMDAASLDEFAAYLAMLQQLVVNRRVHDEERIEAGWQLLVSVAGVAGGLLPSGPATSLAASAAVNGVGLLDPSEVDRARHDAEYGKELTLTTAAASVADTVYRQWVADGSVPASTPPPPDVRRSAQHPALEFRDRFGGWLEQLPGGADGELADRVDRLVSTLMNAADAGAAVAR